ncbi:unnamed protein product (macronuclear) [Paramecium tetraurelia]|uniref:Ancestral coatomer element 1 Sec16/Sec31 domain-containing protein n=1 Tax=Paramecium tetraurelia TaxID=5888 RepID=A0CDC9_PARTE|nr:uncharacterized protein GSPATT00007007001 [Paramecium tetraurelia]CAK68796.1 unnamed protein product [Paramecium tetraurelia]|eukprot:XP_001436193.1 hypothetical protein (macronuclear) [Paramecium tetraurelia strain d4-2]
MKRRQIQVGSPFDEAQSILGDPLWLVNYAIQVPNQPFQEPIQSNTQMNVPTIPKVKELAPIQEIDFREALLQEIDSIQKSEQQGAPVVQQQVFLTQERTAPQQSQPVTQQTQSNQQQSRAQQLIQQSQQLIQRRRQPKQQDQHQNDVNQHQQQSNPTQQANSFQSTKIEENIQQPVIQTNQKQDSQKLKEQQYESQQYQQYEQPQQQQNQDNHPQFQVEVPNDQLQKLIDPPITKANANQNEQLKQNQVQRTRQQVPPPIKKEIQQQHQVAQNEVRQQIPQQNQQLLLNNQNHQNQSSVITAQTFYHGLVSYDICNYESQLNQNQINSINLDTPLLCLNILVHSLRTEAQIIQDRCVTFGPPSLQIMPCCNQPLITLKSHSKRIVLCTQQSLNCLMIKVAKHLLKLSQAYERIYNQNDWETKLLVSILEGEFINTKQQQSLIEYIKKRSYHDDQEAWLIRLAVLLKMIPIDQEYYSELLIQLQHLYSSEQIQARLLWLLLKMEIQNTQLDVFLLSFFTKFNYSLCHSEIQLLIGDSHMCIHNQQNAELYYKLSLLFVESENYDKALECVKFSIDLGYHSKARDLRERILQVIELKEKNKSNNNNSGLFGYFGQAVNAVKNIQKQQPQQQQATYQPQPQNFYYDKQLKAYVINGVPQIAPPEEEQKKEVVVAAPPPPRRKIDPPKPVVYEEQITQQTQEATEDPFASQSQAHQSEHNKKKNNLLRNRYVQ